MIMVSVHLFPPIQTFEYGYKDLFRKDLTRHKKGGLTKEIVSTIKGMHSGAEGVLGEVVRPIEVSYLSESVSTSRFRICRSLNFSLGSE